MAKQIGIDFGTSTTLLAERMGTGPAVILPLGTNKSWIPTVIAVEEKSPKSTNQNQSSDQLKATGHNSLSISLDSEPVSNICIEINVKDETRGSPYRRTIEFNSDNWNKTQILELSPNETSHTSSSSHTSTSLPTYAHSNLEVNDESISFKILIGEDGENHAEPSEIIRSIKSHIFNENMKSTYSGSQIDLTDPKRIDYLVTEIFSEIRRIARDRGYNGLEETAITLSCPAIWEAKHRRRLMKLAQDAGLKTSIINIIDEPIAAGVSWVMHEFIATGIYPSGRTLVFDCGGGTLDIAVIDIKDSPRAAISVLSSNGKYLAGDDYDQAIYELLEKKYDQIKSPEQKLLLKQSAKRLKEQLTATEEAEDFLSAEDRVQIKLTREEFAGSAKELLEEAKKAIFGAMRLAKLREPDWDWADISKLPISDLVKEYKYILFAGGMSKSPVIQEYILTSLEGEVTPVADPSIDSPEESIVSGLTFAPDLLETLNLDRPAFSFFVTYRDLEGKFLEEKLLYEAFSPLYDLEDLSQVAKSGKRFSLRVSDHESAPSYGKSYIAEITCRRLDGQEIPLILSGKTEEPLKMQTQLKRGKSDEDGHFKVYANGKLNLQGALSPKSYRAKSWPNIASPTPSPILLDEVPKLKTKYGVGSQYPYEGH
tara:strand:- start:272 stop:2230 length:1959 start_codon:yes stop_codon:yes gene_type:complete